MVSSVASRRQFDHLRRLEQMYMMAVWSNDGTMYMPLFGYDGQITSYGYASDSIEQWHEDFNQIRNEERQL